MHLSSILFIFLINSYISAADKGAPRRPVEFFAEEITLSLGDGEVSVEGTYHFRNNTPQESYYPVVFPFHVDSLSRYPDYIEASIAGSDSQSLELRRIKHRNAAVINIPLHSNSVTSWRLRYTQKISGNIARYILVSTKEWGGPLEEATYRFIVPEPYRDVTVWPNPDSIVSKGEFFEYWAHESNFMPERDMEIDWATKLFDEAR